MMLVGCSPINLGNLTGMFHGGGYAEGPKEGGGRGHVLFSDPNSLPTPDHLHNLYDF